VIDPVVDVRWLTEHRDEVVLADVRWYLDGRSGRAAYDAGHLPGAVFVDLDRWLAAPPSPQEGRHPLPAPEVFAEGMGALGIGDGTTVVAYDDAGGSIAARLVWMLRVTGRPAALLDGGLTAWDGELSTEAPDLPPVTSTVRPWPADRLADIDEMSGGDVVVVDARDPERYRGEVEPVDARPGHVPGAVNLPFRQHLAPDGTFLPVAQLRRLAAEAGVTDAGRAVVYCGSGVTACQPLLVFEHAGLGVGRLYAGSWSQYSHAWDRPAATGDEPGVDA
jgi:thiosulfate/3-mercaptopyruvate sulfurtransferase